VAEQLVLAIAAEPLEWAIAREAEAIALEAAISRVAAVVTAMLSEAVPGDTTDRTLAPAVAEAPRVWDLAAEASVAVEEAEVEAEGGADKHLGCGAEITGA
jgi:hypothetical protein